ncbi:MAG: hypothetical protein WC975_12730 [Phycisphaerae bacterium]
MKLSVIIGILVAVLGAVLAFRGISYPSDRSVVQVGGFQASVEERREIPAWVGGIAIVGGLALVVAGISRGALTRKP